MLGCREGDSVWGQGESAASLVGPACARDWERGGSRGPALPGLGTGGLWAPRGRLALECSERVVGAERSKSALVAVRTLSPASGVKDAGWRHGYGRVAERSPWLNVSSSQINLDPFLRY